MKREWTRVILVLFLMACFLPAPAVGQVEKAGSSQWLAAAQRQVSKIDRKLRQFDAMKGDRRALQALQKTLPDLKLQSQACIDEQGEARNRLQHDLESITAGGGGAAKQIGMKARAEIKRQLAQAERQLIGCQALMIDLTSAEQKISRLQKEILSGYLLSRGDDIWNSGLKTLSDPMEWVSRSTVLIETRLQIALMSVQGRVQLLLAVLLSGLGGYWLGKRFQGVVSRTQGDDKIMRLYRSICSGFARRLMILSVLSALAAVMFYLNPSDRLSLTVSVLLSILAYMVASLLAQILVHPQNESDYILPISFETARALYRRLQILMILGLIWGVSWISDASEVFLDEQWQVARSVLLTLAIINILALLYFLRRAPGILGNPLPRLLLGLAFISVLIAEYTGYRNLATFIFSGLLWTILFSVLVWIVNILVQEVIDGLDEGRYGWQARVRGRMGLNLGEHFPGLFWLKLVVVMVVWVWFGVTLINIWSYSNQGWIMLYQFLSQGMQLGSFHFMPLQLALGILGFALLMMLVRRLRRDVLPKWLLRSRLDRGAREAVATMVGYVGTMIAAIVGLSLGGFNFTNLAIIAGALSLGIGFGLQNIVHNFVSGIILLFERPIRTGDWIVVGETEGFVRRLSIRSTMIETFDHMEVIVPNSDLISNQVKNWMLSNSWGRIVVKVGVAYGSDVELVEEILYSEAMKHPLVMSKDRRVKPPQVLFREFGDSALNFELRCYISDIQERLVVTSDLNFAIDKAFREAGIEIPFPQRDLHLRSIAPGVRLPESSPTP